MTVRRSLGSVTLLLAISAVIGCGNEARRVGDNIERSGEPPVTYVDDDDPEMFAAIAKARSTVEQFITVLSNPRPSQSAFSVKLLIEDGEHGEHMWILPVRYEAGTFHGTINNEPDQVRTVQIGDEVTVAKGEISDWMYVENRKVMGAYTLRVLRDKMSVDERAEFDRSFPFSIE